MSLKRPYFRDEGATELLGQVDEDSTSLQRYGRTAVEQWFSEDTSPNGCKLECFPNQESKWVYQYSKR